MVSWMSQAVLSKMEKINISSSLRIYTKCRWHGHLCSICMQRARGGGRERERCWNWGWWIILSYIEFQASFPNSSTISIDRLQLQPNCFTFRWMYRKTHWLLIFFFVCADEVGGGCIIPDGDGEGCQKHTKICAHTRIAQTDDLSCLTQCWTIYFELKRRYWQQWNIYLLKI